ncbi:hypothetical protein K8Q94_00440 [Candidatus Nomurabacteria bacterium]|nr:hypothetical protein [Candidatus Nomurabacteria bacterium]
MDPESKKMLEETYAIVSENNKILRKMRSAQRWASIMRYLYWFVIIGLGVGSFYFIQPYVDQMQKIIKDSGATINQFKNIFPN